MTKELIVFSGLIREIAKVKSFQNSLLTIQAKYKPNIGDSISVNGACLTVVKLDKNSFSVELSPESENILATENYQNEVHIEPAMQMGDRFEGHIVQGHIDIIGTIKKVEKFGNSYNIFILIGTKSSHLIIPKGSISVDGVSLTINDISDEVVRLTIIPHTMENTIFRNYKIGTRVNIETDMFARYIDNILANRKKTSWNDFDSIMAKY